MLALARGEPRDRLPVLGAALGADRVGERAPALEQRAGAAEPLARRGLADPLDELELEVAPQHLVVAVGAAFAIDGVREHLPLGERGEMRL